MDAGMPYRSSHPDAWNANGDAVFNAEYPGAHDVAPKSSDGSLGHWATLGLTPPAEGISSDLSNIDDVVRAAKEGLNL